MIKRCEICGVEFVCQRSTAKYCSKSCSRRAERGVVAARPATPLPVRMRMREEDVSALIDRAHDVADDLSRASMLTYAPLSLSLRSVSKKLADALRREGL